MSYKKSTLHDSRFKVRATIAQNMIVGNNLVAWNITDFDNLGELDLVTELFTARQSGYYYFHALLQVTTVLGGTNNLILYLLDPTLTLFGGNTNLENGTVTTAYLDCAGIVYLIRGQNVRVQFTNIGVGIRQSIGGHFQGFKIR